MILLAYVELNPKDMEENNNICSGLPENIKHKVHWLAKPNSATSHDKEKVLIDLVVELQNGKVLGFNKIIMPSENINNIFEEFFSRNILAIETPSRQQKLSIIKQYVLRIYSRIYTEDTSSETDFKKIWLAYRDHRFPWERIEDFNEMYMLSESLLMAFFNLFLEDRATTIGECNYVLKPIEKWQLN
jgi:hypothetical protein